MYLNLASIFTWTFLLHEAKKVGKPPRKLIFSGIEVLCKANNKCRKKKGEKKYRCFGRMLDNKLGDDLQLALH